MGFLGNTPEKRAYNKWVLIFGATFLVVLLGIVIRSIIVLIVGLAFICFVVIPGSVSARRGYYSSIFRRLRKGIDRMMGKSAETLDREIQQRIVKQKEPKESPLLPLIGGAVIVTVFGSLYFTHRHAEVYPLMFRNVAIIGILIFIYGVYRHLKHR